jgi:protocatechuate 3,4-dioxygenase alpha subunit
VPTPSQTVGPYLAIGLTPLERREVAGAEEPGATWLSGRLLDGAGGAVPDGVVELWCGGTAQGGAAAPGAAAPTGGAAAADGAAAAGGAAATGGDPEEFWPDGFGRCLTGPDGEFSFLVRKPASLEGPSGREAPHLELLVFARGLLRSLRTRCYFPDEAELNETDPVLGGIEPRRRATLLASAGNGGLRFDIRLQGEAETVFFGC